MLEKISILETMGYLLGSGFLGSLITYFVTRFLDNKKEIKQRKFWIFRTLVTNLQNRLNYDFVSAVNLVQIDFYNDRRVISAWERYRSSLNWKNPTPSQEELISNNKGIEKTLAELVQSIGLSLGYKQDKLDILDKYYIPQGWHDDNNHLRKKEELLMEILEGKRSLNFNLAQNNKSKKL